MNYEMRIRKINMVAFWRYDVENSACPICHKDLLSPTNQAYQRRVIRNLNNVAIGECNHGVHTECIDRWKLTNNNCPCCMMHWNLRKIVDSSVCVLQTNRQNQRYRSEKHSEEMEDNPDNIAHILE